MDMGGSSASSGPTCQISMLWNWYTIDACFLSRTWHISSKADFAGSVIGVFFLTMAIEGVRRLGREYDRRLVAHAAMRRALVARGTAGSSAVSKEGTETPPLGGLMVGSSARFVPSWPQHLLRSLVYGSQFTAAFLVMLLGMYYNGYILFAIFLGQTTGYVVFGRDTCGAGENEQCGSGACC